MKDFARFDRQSGRLTHLGEWALESPNHPLIPAPTREEIRALNGDFLRLKTALDGRQERLFRERTDPYRFGWEPPVWRVTDFMADWFWLSDEDRERAANMRRRLGWSERPSILLVNGGNRAGKSQYALTRLVKTLLARPGRSAWALHESLAMSIKWHQQKIWDYFPTEMRRQVKSDTEYLGYKQQTGFSGEKFTLENGSDCEFRTYGQDPKTFEGGELDLIWADEKCPDDLAEAFPGRVITRSGVVLHTFTPTDGYTPLVAKFREGARCILDETGWLLPLAANGEPDKDKACELKDVLEWAEKGPPPKTPESARFAMVPRIEAPKDKNKAVLFFHSSDNPFGPPANVVKNYPSALKMRFYGVAEKAFSALLPVDDKVHVIKPSAIPSGGVNIMLMDPAPGRNWALLWVRFHRDCLYLYREWPPQHRPVRGAGMLGPWVEFSGKHPDGRRGEGQTSLGWGLRRYKEEIAEVEGWDDFKLAEAGTPKVDAWREHKGAREVIYKRFMDSRFASAPKQENDRATTTLTQFEEIGLWFDPTSGADIDEGVSSLIDLLYFDPKRPVDASNLPRLYISEECRNVIECWKMWTGKDGNAGASKDFVDLGRYAVMSGVRDHSGVDLGRRGAPPRARHY